MILARVQTGPRAMNSRPRPSLAVDAGWYVAAYLLVSLGLVALYPFLPRHGPRHRLPPSVVDWPLPAFSWDYTGSGTRQSAGLACCCSPRWSSSASPMPQRWYCLSDLEVTDTTLADAAGYLLLLAATLALVLQQRRKNLGRIIDTSIAALALGGVLWDLVLSPNLVPAVSDGSGEAGHLRWWSSRCVASWERLRSWTSRRRPPPHCGRSDRRGHARPRRQHGCGH